MNPFLEGQLLNKAKKLIRRKSKNFKAFQKILLCEEFIDVISAMDDLEESFEDILIFDISPNFHNYEDSLRNEINDIEKLKNEVLKEIEMKIADYQDINQEESLELLNELIIK